MPRSPLIGRVDELAAISSAWMSTNHAAPPASAQAVTVVLITGEAGSGKSRLVAEVLERLRPAPGIVLAGAARTYGPAPHDWLASVLAGRELDDLPVPASVLGWLTQRADEPTIQRAEQPPKGPPAVQPVRRGARLAPAAMLRAATDIVRALLRGQRGVLVVEDLHDLDPASLTLVAELATTTIAGDGATQPSMLLVTSRSLHDAAFPPVAARTFRRLAGTANVVRAHLSPFTARETADLVEACCGALPAPETVRAVHARTGGNPFWLTELIAAGLGADGAKGLATGPLPPHLAALLVERLGGEPPLVGRVARVAALVCDPAERDQVHSDHLYAVCGDDVEAALRRLVDLGMLVVAPDGPLRFRTPLVREAVAGTALPGERLAIHRRSRAFAAELSDDGALARHAAALGRHAEAGAAALRVIRKNTGRPEATLAAVVVGLANSENPNPFLRTGASAALAAGQFVRAADYAAQWLDRAEDLVERADAHRQVAATRWHLGDIEGHRSHLATAAELTAQAVPAQAVAAPGGEGARARQLAAEAETLLRTAAPVAVVAAAEAALEAAVGAGEPAAETSAMVTLGAALGRSGQHDRGAALLRAARLRAQERRELVTLGRALNNLVAVCLPRAGLSAGWRLFDEAMETAARFGLEFNAGKTTGLGYEHALRAGDLNRAESLVWARLPIETDPLERVLFTSAAGLLAVEHGDDTLAARMLARANAEVADIGQHWAVRVAALLAVAVASRGDDPAEATRAFSEYVQRLPVEHHHARPQRLAEAARWALRGGAPAEAVDALLKAVLDDRALGEHRRAGAQLRLMLAAAAGQDAVAAGLAAEAFDGPTQVAWHDAEVHAALARALLRLGRAGSAREHAERAAELLHRWPGWRRDEVDTLLRGVRAGGDLTAREIEVLGCLAAGMSNQQVARSLGISIRTVTVHVSNLLRKTGAASRTEAALWAVRHRLARLR
jgi:DNA-binding NarL/FixJ family response regulator